MSAPIISVSNLGKQYTIGLKRNGDDGLRHLLEGAVRAPFEWIGGRRSGSRKDKESFWALRDASFEIMPGEVVGIIGRNGSGKSTLLKLLSRITAPTSGRIEIEGRVASLLEVGTGFHPELTGRENIFLNGAILGMRSAEIRKKFDEIVEFSEIEKFLDTPVNRYSSGMYVRLAFSVAAHLEPEILIVDEVLAVGDVRFQQKCLGKMEGIARDRSRTVLFVSHSMGAVGRLCTRCMTLESGEIVYHGQPGGAIARYYQSQSSASGDPSVESHAREGSGQLRYVAASTREQFSVGETKTVDFKIRVLKQSGGEYYLSGVIRQNEVEIFMFDSRAVNCWLKPTAETPHAEFEGRLTFKHPWLKPGRYQVDLHIDSPSGLSDVLFNAAVFDVIDEMPYPGAISSEAYRMGFTMPNFTIELGDSRYQTE